MATERATLTVAEREESGSRESRRLRRSGMVPGVVYGGGGDARPFKVGERELAGFLGGGHSLFDLVIDDADPVPVVIKEQQRHPVRGSLLHLDCHEVRLDQTIQSQVRIDVVGTEEAPGVKEGGVLEHVTREVTVDSLPTAIPEGFEVDVSEMEIGDTVQLSVITPPEGVSFVVDDPDEITIATLSPPRLEEEPEPEVEEEAELIGEGEEGEIVEEAGAEAEGGPEAGEQAGEGEGE